MSGKRVSAKIRAAALADLVAGEQPAIVAARYGVATALVRVWKQRFVTASVTENAPVRPTVAQQQQDIGAIILDLLAAKLKASQAIATAASDPIWLAKQSGSELAALGGWLDSTAFAIGDRLARRDPADG